MQQGTPAGLGAGCVPPVLGLGRAPNSHYACTQLMTTVWYLAGALASALPPGPWNRVAAERRPRDAEA